MLIVKQSPPSIEIIRIEIADALRGKFGANITLSYDCYLAGAPAASIPAFSSGCSFNSCV